MNETRTVANDETIVIPVVEEAVRVEKRMVETGIVRVSKHVEIRTETIDTPLLREEVTVKRVPIDRVVEVAPESRYEGDILILPVLEERVVITRQLVLKEELHIRTVQTKVEHQEVVNLRRETVKVVRDGE